MKPKYKHDCSKCVFLGRYAKADLYVCPAEGNIIDTVIARFSSDPPDYISGLMFALDYGFDLSIGENSHMRYTFEALKLAIGKGFRPEENEIGSYR